MNLSGSRPARSKAAASLARTRSDRCGRRSWVKKTSRQRPSLGDFYQGGVVGRGVLEGRAWTKHHGTVQLDTEHCAIGRGYCPPVPRVYATEVRQGDQPLDVVRLCLRRLEILAREIEVDRRQTRCLRVTPACRLDRCEAEAREPHGHHVHAHFRVDEGVELPFGDEIRPLLQRSGPLVEARSPGARVSRLAVSVCTEVKDVELEPGTVEVREPASYDRTPYRMIVNLRRRDTDAQARLLAGLRNRLGGAPFLPIRHQTCA